MRLLYILMRTYPLWAIPLAVVCFDLGRYYRRLRRARQHLFWFLIVLLGSTSLAWLIARGDVNSDLWVDRVIAVF